MNYLTDSKYQQTLLDPGIKGAAQPKAEQPFHAEAWGAPGETPKDLDWWSEVPGQDRVQKQRSQFTSCKKETSVIPSTLPQTHAAFLYVSFFYKQLCVVLRCTVINLDYRLQLAILIVNLSAFPCRWANWGRDQKMRIQSYNNIIWFQPHLRWDFFDNCCMG